MKLKKVKVSPRTRGKTKAETEAARIRGTFKTNGKKRKQNQQVTIAERDPISGHIINTTGRTEFNQYYSDDSNTKRRVDPTKKVSSKVNQLRNILLDTLMGGPPGEELVRQALMRCAVEDPKQLLVLAAKLMPRDIQITDERPKVPIVINAHTAAIELDKSSLTPSPSSSPSSDLNNSNEIIPVSNSNGEVIDAMPITKNISTDVPTPVSAAEPSISFSKDSLEQEEEEPPSSSPNNSSSSSHDSSSSNGSSSSIPFSERAAKIFAKGGLVIEPANKFEVRKDSNKKFNQTMEVKVNE